MSPQNPRPAPLRASRSLCIALVGLSEPEASYVLQRLAVSLPDAVVERFPSVDDVLAALTLRETMPVVVMGSALSDADRCSAADRVLGVRASVAVLDIHDWQASELGVVPRRAAESLVAVAVRAALFQQAAPAADVPQLTEAGVADALRDDQLEVHYQPIVDLRRGEVVAMEALVRWRHPELGLLPPELFVPIAESNGLIVELGRWVLGTACREAAKWHRQGLRLEIAVNVSVRQVTDPGFVEDVRQALAASGLEPEHLLLEVTESAMTEDVQAAALALTQIRATGATIGIDDFGTGYSSLLYLKRYPIGALKVDRSFIAGLGREADDDAIVASIVSLASAVGAVCIAEGVETSDQHARLIALGCDRAQGFLFSPPVPASQVPVAVDAAEARSARAVLDAMPERPRRAPAAVVPDDVVAHIMRLHGSGASYPTIAAALNQMGSVHPKGTRWHRTSVARFIADVTSRKQPIA